MRCTRLVRYERKLSAILHQKRKKLRKKKGRPYDDAT